MSNKTYFETELKQWEEEVEETAEYDLWNIEQQMKQLSPDLLEKFKQQFKETK